ncbi:hypothetical protein M758_10G036500 [Ceratodon purpureus]|nr:hypothetical protein M758_10G036500 [Ceratodon purpureus]
MGRVMVTGATGYLGGCLCKALLEGGHSVVALVRRSSKVKELPAEVELVEGDVRDAESVRRACVGCDYVVHSAALVGSWLPDSSQFIKVNVEGTANVIEAVKATPSIKKLIYTSSFFALGPTDGYIADENQFHSLKTFYSPYEESKALADKLVQEAAAQGVPIVSLYPGVIYGPGSMTKGNSLAELMIERFNGRMPGYPGVKGNKFSFCHIDDVVAAFRAAMETGKEGERYLLCGENLCFHEVFDLAATLTNTNPPKFTTPMWILELAGFLCVQWARFGAWSGISHQIPFVTTHSVEILKHQWAYSSTKAERELGYKVRPLEEGLHELLTWLKASGHIKY